MESPNVQRLLPEMYQHFKGGYYLLVRIGTHHETQEPWAIYRPVDGDESVLYIRPIKDFHSIVEGGEPRFRPVTPEEGEQVAINRLQQQLAKAREEAPDDPEAEMVLDLSERLLDSLQERLSASRKPAQEGPAGNS